MLQKNKINFLSLILMLQFAFLTSCGHLKANKVADADDLEEEKELQLQEVEESEELSDHITLVVQAQKVEAHNGDPSRIIGSSLIDSPGEHGRKTYFLYGAEHLNLENYYFDIPVVYNKAVKKWINYFLTRGRGYFERYSARAGRYAPILGKILEEHGVPRDFIFLAMAESGFHNKAKSWAKAVGPWQFMPYTGKRYGLKIDWYLDERRDPIKSTIAAARYLKKLYSDFGAWELAAAAYNAGEGKVSRAIRRYRTENFWNLRRGRYLKRETKNYVPKIMALAIIGKNLRSFGFNDIDFDRPLDFEEIEVPGSTDLFTLSEALGVNFEEVHRLNPEILRWFTPPNMEKYRLRIPVGKTAEWKNCCEGKDFRAVAFQKYEIRGSRTRLKDVANKFSIKGKYDYVLTSLNDLSSERALLKRGDVILLPFREGQSLKDHMYADLYEKPRKSVVRRRRYQSRLKLAKQRGKVITQPKEYYTVRRGDSLWGVAKKFGVSLDTLIVSNMDLLKKRRIRAGDKLVVR